MTMAVLPALTAARFFGEWQLHPLSAAIAGFLLVGYLAGVEIVRRRGAQPLPARRTAAWMAGVALLVFSTQGSLAVYADAVFWVHMLQHLALIMVVPLALLCGRSLDLVLAVSGARAPAVRRRLTGPVAAVITHPLLTLGLYTVVIAGTHLTGFMNDVMLHPWLHGLESAIYVVTGLLFFAPLVVESPIRWRLPQPMRLMLLVLAMPVDTFTGVILGQSTSYPWPAMAAAHQPWALSPLDDLHAGGAVMWIGGDAIMAVLMGVAAVAWTRVAASGDGSELGGWLSAARLNYQRSVTTGSSSYDDAAVTQRTGDTDDDLADYNAYLARINQTRP
jgi:putative copper resistance protein D